MHLMGETGSVGGHAGWEPLAEEGNHGWQASDSDAECGFQQAPDDGVDNSVGHVSGEVDSKQIL